MREFEAIRLGLGLLRDYVSPDVQVTEAGGHLHVWDWPSGTGPEVPEDVARQLRSIGWYVGHDGMWACPMSQ